MSTDLTLPKGFGPLPAAFAGSAAANDELGQGIAPSYAVMGFRGKVWAVKHGGTELPLMREDGDGPRNSIEVVLVKASGPISKIFYENGYEPGSTAAPDCWSGNGVTPDTSVQKKVHPTCADCPMNAWGSKVTEAGKQAKACADSRRVAIVPAEDMQNEAYGGPMLLRVPAASLKDLKAYGDLMASYQYPYFAAVTRISFDPAESFPKFVLTPVRPLNDTEAEFIKTLRDDRRVSAVLAEKVDGSAAGDAAKPAAPLSPFEVDQKAAAPAETAPKPAPKATAPKPAAPKPAAPKPAATAPAATAAPATTAESPAAKAARLRAELLRAELAAMEAEAAPAATVTSQVTEEAQDPAAGEEELGSDDFEAALEGILGND